MTAHWFLSIQQHLGFFDGVFCIFMVNKIYFQTKRKFGLFFWKENVPKWGGWSLWLRPWLDLLQRGKIHGRTHEGLDYLQKNLSRCGPHPDSFGYASSKVPVTCPMFQLSANSWTLKDFWKKFNIFDLYLRYRRHMWLLWRQHRFHKIGKYISKK